MAPVVAECTAAVVAAVDDVVAVIAEAPVVAAAVGDTVVVGLT